MSDPVIVQVKKISFQHTKRRKTSVRGLIFKMILLIETQKFEEIYARNYSKFWALKRLYTQNNLLNDLSLQLYKKTKKKQ